MENLNREDLIELLIEKDQIIQKLQDERAQFIEHVEAMKTILEAGPSFAGLDCGEMFESTSLEAKKYPHPGDVSFIKKAPNARGHTSMVHVVPKGPKGQDKIVPMKATEARQLYPETFKIYEINKKRLYNLRGLNPECSSPFEKKPLSDLREVVTPRKTRSNTWSPESQ